LVLGTAFVSSSDRLVCCLFEVCWLINHNHSIRSHFGSSQTKKRGQTHFFLCCPQPLHFSLCLSHRVGEMPWAWLAVRPNGRFGDTLQRVRCALRLVIRTQWETFVHWWRVDSRRARIVAYARQTRMWADAQIARTLLVVVPRPPPRLVITVL